MALPSDSKDMFKQAGKIRLLTLVLYKCKHMINISR